MTHQENLEKFMALFSGYEKAHVLFEAGPQAAAGEKQKGAYRTVHSPAALSDFESHFSSSGPGLVIIPIREDNTCLFGAIDIDERGIDLAALEQRIRDLGLPLVVCRSKSAGAHCYLFMREAVAAVVIREVLSNWAAALGYPKAEIFPKQSVHEEGRPGSAINLPYYGGKETERYATRGGVGISANEFLTLAEAVKAGAEDLQKRFDAAVAVPAKTFEAKTAPGIPPLDIIPEGQRHNELLRLGTQLKKQGHGDDVIRTVLRQAAERRCSPPMPESEVDGICAWVEENVSRGHEIHPMTDMGNGRRFADRYKGQAVHCHLWREFLLWDGRRYSRDELGQSVHYAKMTAVSIADEALALAATGKSNKELLKFALQTQSRKRLGDMLWAAQSEMAVHPDDLDRDPWLLNVMNGVLDLKTGELMPHDPALLMTKIAAVTYDRQADCPVFKQYLQTVFAGDKDIISYVQRVVGYCLTGDTREHCLFIMHGAGRNGKSTLLNVLSWLLGEYHVKAEAKTLLAQKHEGVRNDIAALKGARVVTASEIGEGMVLNESLVKELTGGDIIRARFLYQEAFEFLPQFKIFLATNKRPEIRGVDEGIWSRIRLIPFNVTIPEASRDPLLADKLRAELPGILNWALAGLRVWQEGGLHPPQAVRGATEQYRQEMNVVAQFLSECTFENAGGSVEASVLYECWREWQHDENQHYLTQRQFGTRMTEMGYKREKKRDSKGSSKTFYMGLSLNEKMPAVKAAKEQSPF